MTSSLDSIIGKAMTDPAFRQALVDKPEATLQAEGIDIPEGVTVRVVEETASQRHLVLPPLQAEGHLTDDALEGVAGGRGFLNPEPFYLIRHGS